MAHVDVNTVLGSLHGTIDGFVFRKDGDKTLMYRKPERTASPSPAQQATMRAFGDANTFWRVVIKPDPVLTALYRKRGRERWRKRPLNYRQMALRDYFHSPTVNGLNLDGYKGAQGGRLVLTASDDFEVVQVTVTLRDADGAIISSGDAKLVHALWHYEVEAMPAGAKLPSMAEVTAYDRPGNATTRRFRLTSENPAAAKAAPAADVLQGWV